MRMYAVRGAITVSQDDPAAIEQQATKLLSELMTRNGLRQEEVISILFTATGDLCSAYPAVAARKMGFTEAALMCCQEMEVIGSLPRCLRVLLQIQRTDAFVPKPAYLEGAVVLRPDLAAQLDLGPLNIAIDGPAGAGKSTIAKGIARRLGILYLDTGSMYRAAALHMLRKGIDPGDGDAVAALLPDTDVRIAFLEGFQRVLLNGEDVTDQIRTPEVSAAASAVAVIPEVRIKLVELQRRVAADHPVVMDGRDIGTYVLPGAQCKFHLTADLKERAKRRCAELAAAGLPQPFEQILKDMAARDQNDSSRSFAPLRQSEDALAIDTTDKTIDQVMDIILTAVETCRRSE